MDSGWFAKGAELSTAEVVACEETPCAVGKSGHIKNFILCSLVQLGQQVFFDLLGREPIHRQLDTFAQHRVGKFLGGELTTLIRVYDLRHTVPREGFLDDRLVLTQSGKGHPRLERRRVWVPGAER